MTAAEDCSQAFAANELPHAAGLLARTIRALPIESFGEPYAAILWDCEECLDEWGASRMEYVLLAMQTMDAAPDDFAKRGEAMDETQKAF